MQQYHCHSLVKKYDSQPVVKDYLKSNARFILSGDASCRKNIWEIQLYHFQGCTLLYTRYTQNKEAVELLADKKDVLDAAIEKLTKDIPGFKFAHQFVETHGDKKPGLEAKLKDEKAKA
jgi:hypothetical protein